jgi:pimeloyl-ACP methyl ester carboxylesterase/class 3 adenylate cyclase
MPETRYARNGDVHIAYQAFGEGDVTFVGLPGIVNNVEVSWENPEGRRYLTKIASFCRFVVYDKRGQGLSDRDTGVPTLDERLDDLTAVLDAVGCERAALGGVSEGGSTAAMYAATYPERVSHLALFGSFAYVDVERGDPFMNKWAATWGTPETLSVRAIAPSKLGDPAFLRWANHWEHQSSTPGGLLAAWRWIREMDVRPVLGSIQCPTLVMHRTGDSLVRVSFGRELAELIPGARLVELEGSDHAPQWGGQDAVLEQLEPFLTGRRPAPKPAKRVLATVLFTDIVDSTTTSARLGDAAWRGLLDRHDELSRSAIADFGGQFIKETGDGVLATFDAPGRAVQCADALRQGLANHGIAIRAGVHTGEIELRGEDVSGIGVHIAARVNAIAGPDEVLVTRTVKDLVVGSNYAFSSRGIHSLKGVPDEWELLAVAGVTTPSSDDEA